MKASEKHIGLEKKEIRDYLSKSLAETYKKEYSFEKKNFTGESPERNQIKRLEHDIEYSLHAIEVNKERIAILQIMSSEGWKEHDISDYIVQEKGLWLSFIGTEEEYQVIFKKLETNDN
jgi:hypothetical protein